MEKNTKKNFLKYKCALCPYSTKTIHQLKMHTATHSADKPFKCPECPFRAKWKNSVNIHYKNVHQPESRPFPCSHPGCSYAAKQEQKLIRHSKIHSEVKPEFSCSYANCNYSTNGKAKLIVHTRVHSGEKPFVCQFESCSYATITQSNLVVHTRTHTNERPYKCLEPNCEYSSNVKSNLRQHQLTHPPKEGEERPSFKCLICKYKATSKANLSQHVKHKHTLEKPFACPVKTCEYRCKTLKMLSLHLDTHSKERKYKCELCPFRAKKRCNVVRHLKTVHSAPECRPFKCPEPQCDSAFKTKERLNAHRMYHKPEKMFSCSFPDCDYRAVLKCQVTRHVYNIHSAEKREKCPFCEYKCKMKSAMVSHVRTHTKEEPFICKVGICGYAAKNLTLLKCHQKRHHPLISA